MILNLRKRKIKKDKLALLAILIFLLLTLNVCSTSLEELIRENENKKVISILEEEKNWNYIKECESPLHIASRLKKIELLKILIKKGADVNHRSLGCPQESILNIDGIVILKDRFFTATHTALSQSASIEVAEILINAGANPNTGGYRQNNLSGTGLAFYQSPLSVAILDRKYDLAKYLIQKGASLEIYNPLTGENELELWFLSVGIRSKKDKEFFQFLKSRGLKKITAPSRIFSEKEDQNRSYIHISTKSETIGSISKLREEKSFETDLVYSDPEKRTFHSSEFIWKDSGQNLHAWILQRRLILKKR